MGGTSLCIALCLGLRRSLLVCGSIALGRCSFLCRNRRLLPGGLRLWLPGSIRLLSLRLACIACRLPLRLICIARRLSLRLVPIARQLPLRLICIA